MEKTIGFSLDWLTTTVPCPRDLWPLDILLGDKGEKREVNPVRPYNNAWASDERTVYWHSEHPEFKMMTRVDGQNFTASRKRGLSDEEILGRYIGAVNDTSVTRLDFAVDLFDQCADPVDLLHAWQCDQLLTTAQTVGIVDNQSKEGSLGATVYIGSRTSERYVRCYHKGKQQHTNLDWVRVELECKGQRAQELGEAIIASNVRDAGLSMLESVIEWTDVEWFAEIFTDFDPVSIANIGRPESDTERWLRTVCIPAIRKAALNGVVGIVEALEAILAEVDDKGVHGNG